MKTKKLNVNTVYKKNNPKILNISNINNLNFIINKNIDSDYKIVKYIGEGISGHVFLANNNSDTKDKYPKLLCKIIAENDDNVKRKLLIEIGMLKYLANTDVNNFINPCLKFGFVNDKIFTFFPAYSGYKIKTLKNKLIKLDEEDFIMVVTFIIRHVLLALSQIHKKQVAHQNLDDTSIIIDINLKNKEYKNNVKVKIIDFGLGCGIYKFIPEYLDLMKIESKKKSKKKNIKTVGKSKENNEDDIYFEKCLTMPKYFLSNLDDKKVMKDIKKLFTNLNNKKYIKLAQLYDMWCCGIIFYDLICCHTIGEPYINASELDNLTEIQGWFNDFKFKFDRKIPDKLVPYKRMLESFILVPINKRKSANYCLEQCVLYEKFKNKK